MIKSIIIGKKQVPEESGCGKPCNPKNPCGECADYWERMIAEKLWDNEKGCWTEKGWKEITK